MSDQKAAALAWAQANPNLPEAKAVLAKDWAEKNPDNPTSQQILAKMKNPDEVGHPLRDIAQGVLFGTGPRSMQAMHPGLTAGNPPMAIPLEAAPAGIAKLAQFLGGNPLLRVGANAAASAAQGAAQTPGEDETRLGNAMTQGATGGALAGAGEAVSGAATASGLPDWLMQKAVGMKKYVPGVGKELLDEGVVGTKGMMKNQIQGGTSVLRQSEPALAAQPDGALARGGQTLEDLVKGIPAGGIDPNTVASKIQTIPEGFKAPDSGLAPASTEGVTQEANTRAEDVLTRGNQTGRDALHFKRQAAKEAYKMGSIPNDAKASATAGLARAEERGYNQALTDALGQQSPEAAQSFQDTNQSLSALTTAKNAMNKPQTLYKSPLGLQDIALGTIGGASGGLIGGGAGIAASMAMKQPAVQSGLAQGLDKAGNINLLKLLFEKQSQEPSAP